MGTIELFDGNSLPLELTENGQLYDSQLSLLDTLTPCKSNHLMIDLRNAAPKLLEVLSQFKSGDSTILEAMIENMRAAYADELGPNTVELDLLERMHKIAILMESES